MQQLHLKIIILYQFFDIILYNMTKEIDLETETRSILRVKFLKECSMI